MAKQDSIYASAQDAELIKTVALPDGATTDVTASIPKPKGIVEFSAMIDIPVLTTTELPDASTITILIKSGTDDSTFGRTLGTFVVTGAGGAGLATAFHDAVRLSDNDDEYMRAEFTGVAATLSATKTGTFSIGY